MSKTINPLHFEDLEPHRFEDLARQLAYTSRRWRTLEATGRLGTDDGFDIRGIEEVGIDDAEDENEQAATDGVVAPSRLDLRTWYFQAKRVATLGPAEARKIVDEALNRSAEPPFGLVLIASCDLSLRARNAFQQRARELNVAHSEIWSRAELEDLLFSPENDHLLFAYFGLSIQVRRRSKRAELSRLLAIKRALLRNDVAPLTGKGQSVLLRSPDDDRYPDLVFADYMEVYAHFPPEHLALITTRHYAWVSEDLEQWDAALGHALPRSPPRARTRRRSKATVPEALAEFWSSLPDAERREVSVVRSLPYSRILSVDPFGDFYNHGPHVIADYAAGANPFTSDRHYLLRMPYQSLFLDESKRVQKFPVLRSP